MKKVLFFSPHAAVWVHSFPEAAIAESLKQSGHEIFYLACGEAFKPYCISMSAFGVPLAAPPEVRRAVCNSCNFNRGILRATLGFRGADVSQVIDDGDRRLADEIAHSVTRDSFEELEVDGLPVGRLATYWAMLEFKKVDLLFSDEEWRVYQDELRNTVLSYLAIRKVVLSEAPERAVILNAMYPVNRVAMLYLESQGIPTYSLHASPNLAHRLQYMMIGRKAHHLLLTSAERWERHRQIPCNEHEVREITDHVVHVMTGMSAWAFSAPKGEGDPDLRAFFGIPPGARVLLATLSSYDERYAAQIVRGDGLPGKQLFEWQADWVGALIEHVRERPELFLIIRVHPREFRGNVSTHARMLRTKLQVLPSNVRVNWPSDNVSLYDLAAIIDVCLNAWSTAGKEMTLLGIPVVLYSRDLAWYPAELNFVGDQSHEAYFAAIDRALLSGWQAERIVAAYRMFALEHHRTTLDLRATYPHPRDASAPPAVKERLRGYFPGAEQRLDLAWRAPQLPERDALSRLIETGAESLTDVIGAEAFADRSAEEELAAIRTHFPRIVEILCRGIPSGQRSALHHRLHAFLHG